MLRIDPVAETAELVGDSCGPAVYKWCGGAVGPDGCVYALPRSAPGVLRFDPRTGSASTLAEEAVMRDARAIASASVGSSSAPLY